VIFGARELAQRRLALVERSSALRSTLGAAGAPLAARAAAADRLITTVSTSLPWIARGLAVYTLLRRRSAGR
jgi:hypothetical protein